MSSGVPSLPVLGISACLLGESVRYDGGHKHAPALLDALAGRVRWLPVCPELEAGLGVPREPIGLEDDPAGPRVRGLRSGRDRTDVVRAAATRLVRRLADAGACGVVLKSRSPSCGLRDVPVGGGAAPGATGRGLFADALRVARPDWIVVEDVEVATPDEARAFLERVTARSGAAPRPR